MDGYRITNRAKINAMILSIFVIIIAFVVFAFHMRSISLSEDSLKISSGKVSDEIKIYRNKQQIPHIIASNDHDLFFALGYIHARDRLWQMDFTRRTGLGRLSEIIGPEAVFSDQFFRTLGLKEIADSLWNSVSKKTRSILTAYSEGINEYLKENSNKLSFEFAALDYIPEPWEPNQTLIISRLMAFRLSLSFWTDITFGEIAEQAGVSKALEFVPSYPENGPYVIENVDNSISHQKSTIGPYDIKTEGLIKSISGNIFKLRDFLGYEGSSYGSNCWAVKKLKNNPSSVILANDPHLPLSLPPAWYQIHLTTPDINAIGMSIPGTPVILSGRNNKVTWGITNMMLDDCDFFIEKLDSAGSDYYYFNDSTKQKFIYKKDTIKIKGSVDSIYYIRETTRLPVISDFHILRKDDKDKSRKNGFFDKYVLTFRWTGTEKSDEVLAAYLIMKSEDWNQFRSALSRWGSPSLNFTYGDTDGNIGLQPAGLIPVRDSLCNPNIPNPGWIKKYGWKKISGISILPNEYNTDRQFSYSANNKTAKKLKFDPGSHWETSSRAERIIELLSPPQNYSVSDAFHMQMDVLSPYARKLTRTIVKSLYRDSLEFDELQNLIFNKLKNWDYILSASSGTASIYNVMLERMIYNTFHDELGDKLYKQYTLISNFPLRRLLELTAYPYNNLFDDVFTINHENMHDIIKKSFMETINYLVKKFDDENPDKWKYGELHQLTLKHILSENKFLEPTVTLGPFQIGGNITTINNTEWRISESFETVLGASMRFIADMEDSVVYMSVPGGVSGDPLSPHYGDQVQLWLNGGYLTIPSTPYPGEDFSLSVLITPD